MSCSKLQATTSAATTNPFGNQGPTDGVVYDGFLMPMWTAINIANAVTPFTAGSRIQGKTSGAIGYIAAQATIHIMFILSKFQAHSSIVKF